MDKDFLAELSKINPNISKLVHVLEELGYNLSYYNQCGLYGVIFFEYNRSIFGIWINDTDQIVLFYPNWAKMSVSEVSSQLDYFISSNNLQSDSSIYRLLDNNDILLSTKISLDYSYTSDINYINRKLNSLFCSRNRFINQFNGIEIAIDNIDGYNDEWVKMAPDILTKCGFNVIEVDEDGDVIFQYMNKRMSARLTDDYNVKIVFDCMILNCVDNNSNPSEIDMIALSIQWVNMISPYTVTYYRPNGNQHAITANMNIELSHFSDVDVDYISNAIHALSNIEIDYLNDIMFGSEDGIEILDTWYQPDIKNCEV